MKTVELPINEVNKSHNATEINNLVEREAQMVQGDKLENERINAKASVWLFDNRTCLWSNWVSERFYFLCYFCFWN